MKKFYRHGDLLIQEIDLLPTNLAQQKDTVLAEGETTGHKHQLVGVGVRVYEGEGQKYFEIDSPTTLTHQEHNAITIDPGKYIVTHEREYDYFENDLRQVID